MPCMSGSIQTVSEDILPKAAKQESEEVLFQTENRQEVCSQCATMNNILFSPVMCKHLSMYPLQSCIGFKFKSHARKMCEY